MWYKIREFNTEQFRVVLSWEHEQDSDLSWMDQEDLSKIESGEWTNATFRVAVYWRGQQIAVDYLGNSVYADVNDFAREHIGSRGRYGSIFADMMTTAITEARKVMRNAPHMRGVK
jgi:hypothetical protein